MGEGTVRVRFEPDGREADVRSGSTLLQAALAAGITIAAPCGGRGTCGSCRVRASGALSPLSDVEAEVLGGAGVAAGKRLACRARALGDVVVQTADTGYTARIVTDEATRGEATGHASAVGASVPIGPRGLGAAVDLGTTTIATLLVDLASGEVVARASDLNPQRHFGADVMSRVSAALRDGPGRMRQLTALAIEAMLVAAAESAGATVGDIHEIVVVGNTAMTGLLRGADLTALGAAPYEGAPIDAVDLTAAELGMERLGPTRVRIPPGASAFLGSDVTAGLLATELAVCPGAAMFIDLGTNGEMVLSHCEGMLGASAAAGPALEGATIEHGMIAEAGAVERVSVVDGGLVLGVIGNGAPRGICGSGLLDLVAALLSFGVVDRDGRMHEVTTGPLAGRVVARDGVRAFVVDEASGVVLTQRDVREVQLACGAVRTGIELLLAEAGLKTEDVGQVVIAGGFGLHIDAHAVVRVGLVPAGWVDAIAFGGNTALAGARMLLLGLEPWERIAGIAEGVRVLDLAAHPEFASRFMASLSFPEPR